MRDFLVLEDIEKMKKKSLWGGGDFLTMFLTAEVAKRRKAAKKTLYTALGGFEIF